MSVALAVIAFVCLAAATVNAPWVRFRESRFQHVFFGFCVAVFFLWILRIEIVSDLPIHLLCLTTLTLMFGASLAIVAAALLMLGMCLAGLDSWSTLPGHFLALGVVPVLLSEGILRAYRRFMPAHPFVYIFACSFFGAGLVMVAGVYLNGLLLSAMEVITMTDIHESYGLVLPLLFFPEAFLNGLIITSLVVFQPGWVTSFDDRVYRKRRNDDPNKL